MPALPCPALPCPALPCLSRLRNARSVGALRPMLAPCARGISRAAWLRATLSAPPQDAELQMSLAADQAREREEEEAREKVRGGRRCCSVRCVCVVPCLCV
jgi:hypothetical protein